MGKPKKAPKPAASETPAFSITLQLGNNTVSGTGPTALEALQALPKPDKIMAKGIVTITHAGKRKVQSCLPGQLKRLFYSSKQFQAIHAKQLSQGLKPYVAA